MEPIHIAFTDMLQRKRLQTLQSVDDAVEKVSDDFWVIIRVGIFHGNTSISSFIESIDWLIDWLMNFI